MNSIRTHSLPTSTIKIENQLKEIRQEADSIHELGRLGTRNVVHVSGLLFRLEQAEARLTRLKKQEDSPEKREGLAALAKEVKKLHAKRSKVRKIREAAVAQLHGAKKGKLGEWTPVTVDVGKGKWREYYVQRDRDEVTIVSAKFVNEKLQTVIGKGSYGIVRGHQKGEKVGAVAKEPIIESSTEDDETDLEEQIRQLENERAILKEVGPYVGLVSIPKAVVKTPDGKVKLILNRFSNNLEDVQKRGSLDLKKISVGVGNMLGALGYLHSKGYVHRDINSSNIAYVATSDENPLRIADFGGVGKASEVFKTFSDVFNVITPSYFPRELAEAEYKNVKKNPDITRQCAVKHDCYALMKAAVETLLPEMKKEEAEQIFGIKETMIYYFRRDFASVKIDKEKLGELLQKKLSGQLTEEEEVTKLINLILEVFEACKKEAPQITPERMKVYGSRLSSFAGKVAPSLTDPLKGRVSKIETSSGSQQGTKTEKIHILTALGDSVSLQ